MRRIAACLVVAALMSGCAAAPGATPIIVSVTPAASEEPTLSPTREATPAPIPHKTQPPRPTPTLTPTYVAPADLPSYEEVVAAFPAGTQTCATRAGIWGPSRDYSLGPFDGEPASLDGEWPHFCPGARFIVTKRFVDYYGSELPVGTLLTIDADYRFVQISGWSPTPTLTPALPVTEDELLAACEGKPIPHAAKYGGSVHPLVVVDAWGEIDPDLYDINAKWADDLWPSPIQLVLCVDDSTTVKVGSCGTYTRRSDGAAGQIIRYRDSVKVRVVVAATGKDTGYKTFAGSTPQCLASVSLPASGPPPWEMYGDDVSSDAINAYATAVSKKVK